ncbi:hypothetical protein FFK22_039990 [Mycobacterium sp. KBS0706]|uniref:hypothetical protein n=1 Tax=Mycobacterium sp. KBS0706 TaxID=2578109 RepID=UPI00110F7C65|nr:hypothetical protein [Mycobacterium sp. KBS0706]TSD83010.1 hypothetical protein FFK22_039990 [Mycobacterium sp. KBS0706]
MAGNAIEKRMKRFQAAVSDLQKSYGDACDRQTDVLFTTNQRLVQSLQDACRSRHPRYIVVAEATILAIVLDGIERQAQIWTGLTHEVLERCAALVSEPADEGHPPAGDQHETTPAPPSGRPPVQDVSGQAPGNGAAHRAPPPSPAQPEQSDHRGSRRPSARPMDGPRRPSAAASRPVDITPNVDQGAGNAKAADIVPDADRVAVAFGPDRQARPAFGVATKPADPVEPAASLDLSPARSADVGGLGDRGLAEASELEADEPAAAAKA